LKNWVLMIYKEMYGLLLVLVDLPNKNAMKNVNVQIKNVKIGNYCRINP